MDLDLSLPEPKRPREGRRLPLLTLLVALAILALLLFRGPGGRTAADATPARKPLFSRGLAVTLEKRTLYKPAAELWEELAKAGRERATSLFRAGRCRMLAGEPRTALRDFFAAERLGLSGDLKTESARHVLDCFAMLGKFAERDAELRARTGDTRKGAAPEVVARVGDDPVTRDDLTAAVRDEEAGKLAAAGRLDAGALDKAVAARLANPAGLVVVLRRIAARRALALTAEKEGLAGTPEFPRRLAAMRRALLADRLTRKRFYTDLKVSDREIRDHYEAHKDRYVRPAAVKFSWGPEGCKPEKMQPVAAWHAAGDAFPSGLGPSAEADEMLLAMRPGELSHRTVPIGGKRIRFRLDQKREQEVLTFEQAKERVTADVLRAKRMEAVAALQEEVRKDHPVTILDPKLRAAWEAKPAPGGK